MEFDDLSKGSWGTLGLLGLAAATAAGCIIHDTWQAYAKKKDSKVVPVKGSILYCDLVAGRFEHSGVYVGNGNIVELNGDGNIKLVDANKFLTQYGMDKNIYVSCQDNMPKGSLAAANRAMSKVGTSMKYNILTNNCHKFSSGCLTGNFEEYNVLFTQLCRIAKEKLQVNRWLLWDY